MLPATLHRLAAGFVLTLLAAAPGCEFAAKQAYYGAEGIQSRWLELDRPAGNFAFDRYQSVEVATFDSRLGSLVPTTVTGPVQARIVRNIAETKFFKHVGFAGESPDATGDTLLIRGTFIDFHPGAGLNRTIAFGGEGLLTALVFITDKETGQVLWRGHASGFLRATISGKIEQLGEGIGESLQEVLEKYHSPAGK